MHVCLCVTGYLPPGRPGGGGGEMPSREMS